MMKTTGIVWQHAFGMLCLVASSAVQAQPARGQSPAAQRSSATERRAQRCLGRAPERTIFPQGTLLWGTERQREQDESSSVLVSVALDSLRRDGERVSGPKLSGGRLVSGASRGTVGAGVAAGTELRAVASDGRSVDVVLCNTEPSPGDPELVWYSVEYWNQQTESWENPCAGTEQVPQPRALLVPGVWGADGARRDPPGEVTLACETGVIAKCIQWGYKPWATKNGKALAEYHQACTRMARADYCGDGRSHTRTGTKIDMYDSAGVQQRTTERTAGWDPARAVFEAAWTPEGAYCMTRSRDGRAIEEILGECRGRRGDFRAATEPVGPVASSRVEKSSLQGGNMSHARRSSLPICSGPLLFV